MFPETYVEHDESQLSSREIVRATFDVLCAERGWRSEIGLTFVQRDSLYRNYPGDTMSQEALALRGDADQADALFRASEQQLRVLRVQLIADVATLFRTHGEQQARYDLAAITEPGNFLEQFGQDTEFWEEVQNQLTTPSDALVPKNGQQ